MSYTRETWVQRRALRRNRWLNAECFDEWLSDARKANLGDPKTRSDLHSNLDRCYYNSFTKRIKPDVYLIDTYDECWFETIQCFYSFLSCQTMIKYQINEGRLLGERHYVCFDNTPCSAWKKAIVNAVRKTANVNNLVDQTAFETICPWVENEKKWL
jgi:hypothetical protein